MEVTGLVHGLAMMISEWWKEKMNLVVLFCFLLSGHTMFLFNVSKWEGLETSTWEDNDNIVNGVG